MEGNQAEGAKTFEQQDGHARFAEMTDEQLMSSSVDMEFNRFKAEQRTLLEQRNQIQKRIESMRREYDFI